MRLLLLPALALLALAACSPSANQPSPVVTENGVAVYMAFTADGETWDYMNWRPGVHTHLRYGTAGKSGKITWGPTMDIETCMETHIDPEGGFVRWWIPDNAPAECYPPDPTRNQEPAGL